MTDNQTLGLVGLLPYDAQPYDEVLISIFGDGTARLALRTGPGDTWGRPVALTPIPVE